MAEPEILFDREALIASLRRDERFQALQQDLAERKEGWMGRIAHLLMGSPKALDQRKVDYTRGWFDGQEALLSGRIAVAEERLTIHASRETEESDT